MSVRVATALVDTDFEHRLVQRLAKVDAGAFVVRRCLDLIELRSVAAAHLADVVVVDPNLRGFDRDVVSQLHTLGVRVVGVLVSRPGEPAASSHVAFGLGMDTVVAADPDEACRALRGGVTSPPALRATQEDVPEGQLIAVWGPLGSPGRTTVATALAGEFCRAQTQTLLADADSYGASMAQQLGLLDDASGLAAACRLASAGRFGDEELGRCSVPVPGGLRVLTGIARPERWDELRPASLEAVWAACRRGQAVTIVDIGFCVEHDELAWADGGQPQRNQASVVTLRTADVVVAVADPTPVGLVRFIRDLPRVRSLAPTAQIHVVVNRAAKRDEAPVRDLMATQLGLAAMKFLPTDAAVVDAWRAGHMLSERRRRTAMQKALSDLVEEIVGELVGVAPSKVSRRSA